MKSDFSLGTVCVQASPRAQGAPFIHPVDLATIHDQGDAVGYGEIKYPRFGTLPNQTALGEKLAALEGGEAAVATSSGVVAISAALMSIVKAGDHIIASRHLYGGTAELFSALETFQVSVTYLDDLTEAALEQARRPTTKALYVEAISNPTTRVPNLQIVTQFAKRYELVSLIDNTFATPIQYRPLQNGFDIVLHSASKFLNGHSDLVAGVVAGSQGTVSRVCIHLRTFGGFLDPMGCFMLDRGLKTLALRVSAQASNAKFLANRFANHPKVTRVLHPSLESHPDHHIAREQFSGFGSMMAVEFISPEVAQLFVRSLRLACHSASLGGVETLVSVPSNTSHATLAGSARISSGISPALVRVSVGIEDPSDLWADFLNALSVTPPRSY